MKKDFSAKKIAIVVVALLVLFIPTYIAIGNYYNTRPNGPATGESTYLYVMDPKNQEFIIQQEETARWSLFEQMIRNGQSVSSIPDSVNRDENMLLAKYITVTSADSSAVSVDPVTTEEKQYAFYFTTDKSNCYFMDPENRIYRITEADVNAFLADDSLSAFLFRTSELPTLTVLSQHLTPANTQWNYLTSGNAYQTSNETSSITQRMDYVSGEDLPFVFSKDPDKCTVKIVSSDGVLYDGSYLNLIPVTRKKNCVLTVTVSAEWTKDNNRSGYGTLDYTFYMDLSAAAAFLINRDSMNQGDMAVISVQNVKAPSRISFSSVPSLPYAPVFYETGYQTYSALIPVSYGCSKGTYTMHVAYGSASQDFTLKVEDYKYQYKDGDYPLSQTKVDTYYNATAQANYSKLVAEICGATSSSPLFVPKFQGYDVNKLVVQGFGRNIIINKNNSLTFEHTGVDIKITSAAPVEIPAMNRGKVVYTGNDAVLGKFVVIDHGCGLRSWYAHLTEISANLGEIVEKGAVIGTVTKNENTGFTDVGRFHVGFSVGNQWVAPYGLWTDGLVIPAFAE